MAAFILLEINGDHIDKLDDFAEVTCGSILAAVCRNPSNRYMLEQTGLDRAVRVVGVRGNPLQHDEVSGYWLEKVK